MRSLRHTTAAVAALAAVALAAAGAPAGRPARRRPDPLGGAEQVTGTVQFWHFFTDREAKAIQASVDDFEAANPGVKVVVKSGQDDDKMRQAIAAGQPIDVGLSYSTDIVGNFCSSGAWVDLKPLHRPRQGRPQPDPAGRARLHRVRGQAVRHAVARRRLRPLLQQEAARRRPGYTEPPKTLAELTEMAKKLTVRNPDGTHQGRRLPPAGRASTRTPPRTTRPLAARSGSRTTARRTIGSDPAWKALLNWQKDLVDWYGYDNLKKFTAGLGHEFSADNAFQTGKVAMNLDGEYRHGVRPGPGAGPEVRHRADADGGRQDGSSTAPATSPATSSAWPRAAKNPEAAWALIKYLTTDTDAIVKLANGIKNVPTTHARPCRRPDLQVDDEFKMFLDIFANPNSATTPASRDRRRRTRRRSGRSCEKWQAGKVTDLPGRPDRRGQADQRRPGSQPGAVTALTASAVRPVAHHGRRDGPADGSGSSCCRCWRPCAARPR